VHLGDYTIGSTGIASPVDITVIAAGFYAGNFGRVYVAGHNYMPDGRGYHLVAINPTNGQVEQIGSFDTFADPLESARLAAFVARLPPGEIVAGAGVDDVSYRLQPAAIGALGQLGVRHVASFREGHAFIGVKGAQPGEALEEVNERWPANVAVGKNVHAPQVSVALGGIWIE